MAESDEQLAAPSKEQLEQEKQLLLAFKPVMQKFLHDHTELQVSALYALQVHCNASAFPKGTRPPDRPVELKTHVSSSVQNLVSAGICDVAIATLFNSRSCKQLQTVPFFFKILAVNLQ